MDQLSDMEENFIEVKMRIEQFLRLDVDYKNQYVLLGNAHIQIINSKWSDIYTYLESIIHEEGIEKSVKQNYIYLLDALKSVEYGQSNIRDKLAVIQFIGIFKEYRGHSLFNNFFKLILDFLKKLDVDFVILEAYPVGIPKTNIEQIQKEKSKLQKFYAKYGFIFYYCAYAAIEPYMYLNLIDPLIN